MLDCTSRISHAEKKGPCTIMHEWLASYFFFAHNATLLRGNDHIWYHVLD